MRTFTSYFLPLHCTTAGTVFVLRPVQSAAAKRSPERSTDAQDGKALADFRGRGTPREAPAQEVELPGGRRMGLAGAAAATPLEAVGRPRRRSSPRCGETVPYFSRQEL